MDLWLPQAVAVIGITQRHSVQTLTDIKTPFLLVLSTDAAARAGARTNMSALGLHT